MKPSAASDDEDSINSNISPRPDSGPQQDPMSLGLTGTTGRGSQELARPPVVHTTGQYLQRRDEFWVTVGSCPLLVFPLVSSCG